MRRSTLVAALLLVFGLGLAWVLAVWSAEPERGGSPTLPAVTVTVSGGPGTSPAPPPPPPSAAPGTFLRSFFLLSMRVCYDKHVFLTFVSSISLLYNGITGKSNK